MKQAASHWSARSLRRPQPGQPVRPLRPHQVL